MKELLEEYHLDMQAQKVIRTLFSTHESVFLTGPAGTGKTKLLHRILEAPWRRHIFLTPTEASAFQSGAETIHSFFRLPQRSFMPDDRDLPVDPDVAKVLAAIDLVIIEDIQWVRSDLMNAVDLSIRNHLGIDLPFGGKQLLLVGDLYQGAPPEDQTGLYPTRWFFGAPVFQGFLDLRVIELNTPQRYHDRSWFELLLKMRQGKADDLVIRKLNSRISRSPVTGDPADGMLVSLSNLTVDRINQDRLDELPGEQQELPALCTGILEDYALDPQFPVARNLKVKPEARIVFVTDDPNGNWNRGTTGKILGYSEDAIEILIDPDEKHVTVERYTWNLYVYGWEQQGHAITREVTGTLTQFPIRIAWAQNIRALRGFALESCCVDLGSGAYVHGQAYFAISRCKSIDGLMVRNLVREEDCIADVEVNRYMSIQTSAYKNDELWTLLLENYSNAPDPEQDQKDQHLQFLEQTVAEMSNALERAREEIDRGKVRVKNLDASLEDYQKKIIESERERSLLDQDFTLLEDKLRRKDRWINLLIIIQLIFFLAAMGLIFLNLLNE